MRRKDKALEDRSAIDRIIHEAAYCHLSCSLNDQPYGIPISFGYDGQALYIHTAPSGKKIEIFEQNPRVWAAFVSRVELTPDLDQACHWSQKYASVLAEGSISEITDPGEKHAALNQIMTHYSGRDWEMPASKEAY